MYTHSKLQHGMCCRNMRYIFHCVLNTDDMISDCMQSSNETRTMVSVLEIELLHIWTIGRLRVRLHCLDLQVYSHRVQVCYVSKTHSTTIIYKTVFGPYIKG